MVILETKRLLIRQFHLFDGEAMERVFGEPEVMRFGPGVQSRQWVQDWLRGCLQNYNKLGLGPWAVVEKMSRQAIGYSGLCHFPDIEGHPEIEIGYRLALSFWNQGFATEAILTIRNYAFNVLCLPRLIALTNPQNTASIHVAEKAGMRYEREVMLEGYTYPDHLYSIHVSQG
ncbi:MAG: GNAT family N-acetyltransferase [Bacteroidota bacterium]